jgi:septin family protein
MLFIKPDIVEKHSDFPHLRSLLLDTCTLDLISTTEQDFYETYRRENIRKSVLMRTKEDLDIHLRYKYSLHRWKEEKERFRKWQDEVRSTFPLSAQTFLRFVSCAAHSERQKP